MLNIEDLDDLDKMNYLISDSQLEVLLLDDTVTESVKRSLRQIRRARKLEGREVKTSGRPNLEIGTQDDGSIEGFGAFGTLDVATPLGQGVGAARERV